MNSHSQENIYPLAADNWDQKEIDAINQVVATNRFTMGEKVKDFERLLGSTFESKYVVMVNSGSSANLVMLAALKTFIKSKEILNPTIIVPAVSWSTTYTPAWYLGFKLKFVDIDPETFGLSSAIVEAAIDGNTVAILTVNLLGSASDLSNLTNLAKKHNIFLLEDNCESLGATLNDKFTGSYGIMASHSSFFSHHINTMEGGWVTTDHKDLYEILLSLRAHGWTRELPLNSKIRTIEETNWFDSQFEFVLPGLNFRPLEIEAAIGIVQLDKVEEMLRIRRQNADYFRSKFQHLPEVKIQNPIGNSSWFAFALLFTKQEIRNHVALKLRNSGIECRPIVTGNFTRQPVMKMLDHEIVGNLRNSNLLHENGLYVGNHPVFLNSEIDILFQVVCEGLEEAKRLEQK